MQNKYYMPESVEHEISSLSEYIDLILSGRYENSIYRGEPQKYPHSNASAFRRTVESGGKYPFLHMKNEFKRETYYKITPDQRHDFLAFAQHHGIPTNLLDFTTSPLIALFFACKPYFPQEESIDSSGYVYLVRNHLLNVTKLISENENDNLLDLLLVGKKEIMAELYLRLSQYEQGFPEVFYTHLKKLHQTLFPEEQFPAYEKGAYRNEIPESLLVYKDSTNKKIHQKLKRDQGELDPAVTAYLFSLQYYLKEIREGRIRHKWIDCLPNFTYQPIFSFERGKNQLGLFLYQNYLTLRGDDDSELVALQRIWPDVKIKVNNPRKILKQLDLMGINEKFIYGDVDSIARYITNKYKDSIL